jgi:hypothetical protein
MLALLILARNCSAPSDKKSIIHKRSDFVNEHISSFFFFVQILQVLLEAKPPTVTAREWQSFPKYYKSGGRQNKWYALREERERETKLNEIERETDKKRRNG